MSDVQPPDDGDGTDTTVQRHRAHRDPGGDGALLPRLRHVGHRLAGAARRARRPQAGAPSDPLGHARPGRPARSPDHQVRPGHRRGHGQVPPPRRRRDLRRPGAHGPGLQPAPPADPPPRATSARLDDPPGGRPLHRVPPGAHRHATCSRDIDEDTVDFGDNYSGEFEEPLVLPSRFPNLLVNGCQGIAVGMATNIPPHNLGEVIDAVDHLHRPTPRPRPTTSCSS